MSTHSLKYNVAYIRSTGLEAKWSKNRKGTPIIEARKTGTVTWYYITASIWGDAKSEGLLEAFTRHTLLGHFFSIPV